MRREVHPTTALLATGGRGVKLSDQMRVIRLMIAEAKS